MFNFQSSSLRSALCALCFVLSACSAVPPPDIAFIGVASGTMLTAREDLRFGERFPAAIHSIIGVAALKQPANGARVQATWFSPDDRRMPLGRRMIMLESGATVARFTLTNTENWVPAPYMLDIRVYAPGKPDEAVVETGSGQVQFFVGMNEKAIAAYGEEFKEYQVRESEIRLIEQTKNEETNTIISSARLALGAPKAILALTADLTGDTSPEFVILDTGGQPAFVPSPGPSPLLSATVRGFAIFSGSGDNMITRTDGPLVVVILPSGTISITKDGKTEEQRAQSKEQKERETK